MWNDTNIFKKLSIYIVFFFYFTIFSFALKESLNYHIYNSKESLSQTKIYYTSCERKSTIYDFTSLINAFLGLDKYDLKGLDENDNEVYHLMHLSHEEYKFFKKLDYNSFRYKKVPLELYHDREYIWQIKIGDMFLRPEFKDFMKTENLKLYISMLLYFSFVLGIVYMIYIDIRNYFF